MKKVTHSWLLALLLTLQTKEKESRFLDIFLSCAMLHVVTHFGCFFLNIVIATNSKFGLAFEEAARRSGSRILYHSFDSAAIHVLRDDIKKFMDILHSGLV